MHNNFSKLLFKLLHIDFFLALEITKMKNGRRSEGED